MEDVSEAQLAAFFTRLLRTLGHTQAHHSIFHVGAGAHIAALLPELAHRVDGASVDTNLVREAGGRGAATVVGDGRGQVAQGAAHRGVDTVASTLILITALGLPKGWCPVWRAGGRGLSFAFLLPAGTDEVGSALAGIGQCRLQAVFTVRHRGQVTAHQVTHTLILRAALVCVPVEAGHFTQAACGSSGRGAGMRRAVDLPSREARADLAGLVVRDPGF